MFRIHKSKIFFKDKVKKLMRKAKNSKLISIIEKEEKYPTLIDSTGKTLLHIAARYGNAEMIRYFIDAGYDIDAKDLSGTTPLMIATKYNHCLAMKLLLEANADIFTTNLTEEYPLKSIFDRSKTVFYSSVIKIYYKKVKSISSNDEEVVETLLKAGCLLDQAVVMQDPKLTQLLLEKVERFDDVICCRSVLISMFLIDSDNLKALLHYGSQVTQRIEDFSWYLHDMCNSESIVQAKQKHFFGRSRVHDTIRVFVKNIIEWDVLNQQHIKYFKYIFEDADKNILEIFLEFGIHDYVKSRFRYNLLAHVFGNKNTGVIQLLQNMNVDVKACSNTGDQNITALHIAVFRGIPSSVKLLLDEGVDPNSADMYGETPLFCILNSRETLTNKIECVDLLLKNNVDVEICDNSGNCFIEYVDFQNDDHLALAESVLAHLAMLKAMNLPVTQTTLKYIDEHDELKNRYETCQRQLQELKIRNVARSFSLITVLTNNPGRIARFVSVNIGNIVRTLKQGDNLRELNGYYSKQFKERLNRALIMHRLRTKLDNLIEESIATFNGYNPVVDNIVSYFSYKELVVLCEQF